ncbi:hypothetical protein [Deinococcus sp. Leaf326]|nr:hypothetical protein [Deinococcus sp. Leaf326]
MPAQKPPRGPVMLDEQGQQQFVQVRAAHEHDLAVQAARLGEENALRKR